MNYFIINSNYFDEGVDTMNTNKEQTIIKAKKTLLELSKPKETVSLESAQFVKKMLKDIPKDLRNMFMPKNTKDLEELEIRLIGFASKQKERQQIMELQKRFNLDNKPNMSLRDTAIRVKIAIMGRDRRLGYDETNYIENDNAAGAGSSSGK